MIIKAPRVEKLGECLSRAQTNRIQPGLSETTQPTRFPGLMNLETHLCLWQDASLIRLVCFRTVVNTLNALLIFSQGNCKLFRCLGD